MTNTKEISGWTLSEKEQLLSPSAYVLWYKSLLGPAGPEGKSTFLHLIVRPWNPIPFFQMASEAADLAGLASFDLPNDPVQPKQPSHCRCNCLGLGT